MTIGLIQERSAASALQRPRSSVPKPPVNLPTRLAFLALLIAPLQIFLFPVGGIYPSLYLLIAITVPFVMPLFGPWRWNIGAFVLLALLIYGGVSILWSPDQFLGFREIVYSLPFLAFYIIGSGSPIDISMHLESALKKFCIICAIHSFIVACFLFMPSVEAAFWQSSVAKIFINPNGLEGFSLDFGNNALDPWKAGGFFLNANTSAVLAEAAGFISAYVATQNRVKFWYLVALVNFAGAAASGSKAAFAMVAVVPILAYFITRFLANGKNMVKLIVLLFVAGCVAAIAYFVYNSLLVGSALMDDADMNAYRRSVIWSFAWSEFLKSPIFGLGYGGWPLRFAPYGYSYMDIGLNGGMAPHNSLIYFWAQSGILSPILALTFIFYSIKRILSRENLQRDLPLAWASFGCLTSFFVHSLSENYTLFNEPHFQAPIALFIGYACRLSLPRVVHRPFRGRPTAPRKFAPGEDGNARHRTLHSPPFNTL